tara:strand:+ start:23047 stop:23910 length:864 start_codon:yes stop_codon:yes gene_type:complete
MKLLLIFLFLLVFSQTSIAQPNYEGLWKGMIMLNDPSPKKADVLYVYLEKSDNKLTGRTRIEILDQSDMVFKSFEGEIDQGKVILQEDYVRNSSETRDAPKCKLNYELKYIDSSGYLSGTFKSSDCRGVMGKVVLYKTDGEINKDQENSASHLWKKRFAENYSNGYPAPNILEMERKNFKFEPIYFDHDKSEIRPEHHAYLNKLARILGGIHDLRVEVIGHTDAVGTDEYNIGLSERRAKAIKDYFKSRGIESEKLEIDFKGESQPVDSNATPDGKQRNRRVDFKFI